MENVKLTNFKLNDDIKNAKAIIDGKINNNPFIFSEFSPIYKSTNECLSHKPYIDTLMNKKRVLSITGSGDQIINNILFGTEDIVGLDISTFPKYFLSLKLAAIKVLKEEDYLEYFYGIYKQPFLDKYYNTIRNELDHDSQVFWDSLYNEYNTELYDSKLFNDFNPKVRRAVLNNPFLQDDFFNVLKRKLEKVNVELLKYDMFNANKLNKGLFDLINLSNIINNSNVFSGDVISSSEYQDRFLNAIKKYKKFLTVLPLNKNGIAFTYNFAFNGEIEKYFKEKEYQVFKIVENTELFTCENEILIYKKTKR